MMELIGQSIPLTPQVMEIRSISEVLSHKLYISGLYPLLNGKFHGKIIRLGDYDKYADKIQKADITIKIPDCHTIDISGKLNYTYQIIDSWIDNGDKVLVHCACGISRSATIIIYYLMKKKKISFKRALDYLRKKRSIVDPNIGFASALIEAEARGYV